MRGAALRLIGGVCLGDPKSWMGRENDGSVLSWEEAGRLALRDGPDPDDGPSP